MQRSNEGEMKNSMIAVAALLGIAACSDSKSAATAPGAELARSIATKPVITAAVASVTVTAPTTNVAVGQTLQLTATTLDANGKTVVGARLTWGSSNTKVATITANGLVTAVASGVDSVGAQDSGGKYGFVVITVGTSVSSVASVTVTAPTTNIAVGQTLQLTATTIDSKGKTVTGNKLTWGSSNTKVATITTNGLVTAVASGIDSVGAQDSGGKYGFVVVNIGSAAGAVPSAPSAPSAPADPAAPSAPSAPSASGTPFVNEDFSTYTSTAQLLADPRGIYQTYEDIHKELITLDPQVGYGTSHQSMRYDYPDQSNASGSGVVGRCTSAPAASRSLKFPNDGKISEVWVELTVKTSTNFSTIAPASWGCTSDQGLKFVDGNVTPGDRFSIGLRTGTTAPTTGQLWFGYPDNVTDPAGKVNFSSSANAVDGNWHNYRCHWKMSSGYPGPANADGRITCWVDGRLVVDEQNIKTTSSAGNMPPSQFYGLALARNLNQGPAQLQSIWWGQVKIYQNNPGW